MVIKMQESVDSIRFDLLEWKLRNCKNSSIEREEIPLAINEYKRFLQLKQSHLGKSLSPSKLMDAVWHIHILDTKMYSSDCQRIFGKFLHHAPSYGPFESFSDENRLKNGLNLMAQLYQNQFGSLPAGLTVSICSSACSGVDDFGPNPECGDDDDG